MISLEAVCNGTFISHDGVLNDDELLLLLDGVYVVNFVTIKGYKIHDI